VRSRLGVPRDIVHGPGQPGLAGRADAAATAGSAGAIVVQSYDRRQRYSEEDRALLAFVAQHILTALDRNRAQEELERRVEERTRALQQANRVLQGRSSSASAPSACSARCSGSPSCRSPPRPSSASTPRSTRGRRAAVRAQLLHRPAERRRRAAGIPVLDRRTRPGARRRTLGKGLTEYVLGSGQALLADRPRISQLEDQGMLRSHGTLSHCWLGVPLMREDKVGRRDRGAELRPESASPSATRNC
jgi:hypothetical protein